MKKWVIVIISLMFIVSGCLFPKARMFCANPECKKETTEFVTLMGKDGLFYLYCDECAIKKLGIEETEWRTRQ